MSPFRREFASLIHRVCCGVDEWESSFVVRVLRPFCAKLKMGLSPAEKINLFSHVNANGT
eukprot:m.293532 g.293532  ORF g.293532 m.293532 type:complete len:60 (-) comp16246_c0_seq6:605-784(-)